MIKGVIPRLSNVVVRPSGVVVCVIMLPARILLPLVIR
jgi:hypothetical protein